MDAKAATDERAR